MLANDLAYQIWKIQETAWTSSAIFTLGSSLGYHNMKFRSSNKVRAWHAHTDQPLWQASQHSQPLQGTAALQQLSRHLQLSFRRHSCVLLSTDKTSNWSIAGIHNLFNSGTPKKYYTFFLSTLDFDLSNCNWWSNFSKIVFYILQSTVYCISLIGHIMIYCLC